MPLSIQGYTVYDTPINRGIYVELFDMHKKYLKKYTIVEDYKGQKHDLAWDHVFASEEARKLNLTNEIKDVVRRITKES
jgi:hypothetical protein